MMLPLMLTPPPFRLRYAASALIEDIFMRCGERRDAMPMSMPDAAATDIRHAHMFRHRYHADADCYACFIDTLPLRGAR